MSWASVIATTENFQPLIGVEVECFDVDTLGVLAVVTSDLGGVALFTDLPDGQRFFFKVRARRTSTRVQGVLDPTTGRTYTGQVRLQILAMHPGTVCYDAVVDASGLVGTHKTIQAAIDSFKTQTTGTFYIGVYPGTYLENLSVAQVDSEFPPTVSLILESVCRDKVARDVQDLTTDGGGLGLTGLTVNIAPTTGIPLTLATNVSHGNFAFFGFRFIGNNAGWVIYGRRAYLRLVECHVHQLNSGGTGVTMTDKLMLERCQVETAVTKQAVSVSGGPGALIKQSAIFGLVSVLGTDGCTLENTGISGSSGAGAAVLTLGDTSTVSYKYRMVNCFLNQKNLAGDGLHIKARGGPSQEAFVVVGNQFQGTSGSTGKAITTACTIDSPPIIIDGNTFQRWSVGIAIGAGDNVTVGFNAFENVTTQITGTTTPPVGIFDHKLLSAVHTDSLPADVVDGSIIIGNVTPKWSALVISIPAANVRNVFAIDNAELRPSWKAALDATHPADIAATATEGTSLIFAHRDHVHAHPAIVGDLHTGYFLLAGRAGGQTAYGGTGADEILRLRSTSHADHAGGISFEDDNFGVVLTATGTSINCDPGDFIAYNRGTNTWSIVIGNVDAVALTSTVMTLFHAANFYLAYDAGPPVTGTLSFDNNDYLRYDMTNNVFAMTIGGYKMMSTNLVGGSETDAYYQMGDTAWPLRFIRWLPTTQTVDPAYVDLGVIYYPFDDTAHRYLKGRRKSGATEELMGVWAGHSIVFGSAVVTDQAGSCAIPTDKGLGLYHIPTITAGAWYELQSLVEANPGGASSALYDGLRVYAQTKLGNAQNFSGNPTLVGLDALAQHLGSGTLVGMWGGHLSNYIGLGAGNVTTAYGAYIQSVTFLGGSAAQVTGTVIGLDIDAPILGAGPGVVANYYGIYLTNCIVATTLNIGMRIEGMSTAALWLSSDTAAYNVIAWGSARDTNLYRLAANVLKTDDALQVLGHAAIGAAASIATDSILLVYENVTTFANALSGAIVLTSTVGAGEYVRALQFIAQIQAATTKDTGTTEGVYVGVNNLAGLGTTANVLRGVDARVVQGGAGKTTEVVGGFFFVEANGGTCDVMRGLEVFLDFAGTGPTAAEGLKIWGAFAVSAPATVKGLLIADLLCGVNKNPIAVEAQTLATATWSYHVPALVIGAVGVPAAGIILGVTGDMALSGTLNIGADTNLYRSAADTLKTDDSFHVGADFKHLGANIGFFNHAVAARAAAYTPTNVTPDRSYDADVTTLDEIADVVGTLIADLQSYGLLQ